MPPHAPKSRTPLLLPRELAPQALNPSPPRTPHSAEVTRPSTPNTARVLALSCIAGALMDRKNQSARPGLPHQQTTQDAGEVGQERIFPASAERREGSFGNSAENPWRKIVGI